MKQQTPKQSESLGEIPQVLRDLVLTNASEAMVVAQGLVVVEANARFARLFGYERREDVIGLPYSALATQESVHIAEGRLAERASGGSPASTQLYVYVRKDGEQFTGESSAISWPGEPALTVAIIRDVTERERRIEVLQESEKRYRTIAETVPVGVMLTRPSEQRIHVNEMIQKMTGYTAEELLAGQWVVDPEDTEARRLYMSAITEGTAGTDYETHLVRKDGKLIPVSASWSPVRADDGTLIGVHTTFMDVTERKRAEDSLRESEALSRTLIEAMQHPVALTDIEGRCLLVNEAFAERLGVNSIELIGRNWLDFLPKEIVESRQPYFDEVVQSGKTVEFSDERRDRYYRFYVTPVFDRDGKVIRVAWVAIDLRGLRKAERALRKSEASLRTFINALRHPAALVDTDGTCIVANETLARRYGVSADEFVGRDVWQFGPAEVAERRRDRFDDVIRTGEPVEFEDEREGVSFRHYVSPVFDQTGKVSRVAWISLDITDRVALEKGLHASEMWFRRLVENIPGAVIRLLIRRDWTIDFASDGIESITGYPENYFLQKGVARYMDLVHTEDRDDLKSSVLTALKKRQPFTVQFRLTRRDGSMRFCHVRGQGARDSGGRLAWVDLVAFDIMELHQAEEAAREAQERYRLLAENASDMIYELDLQGKFTYISPGIRALGYEPDEWIGKSFASLLAPYDESALLEVFEKDISDPLPKRYILRVPHKNGTECWRDISVSIVVENGQPVRVQGIARDITINHNAEIALRESEASLRMFIEAIRQPVALADLEGRCVVANESLADRLGVTPDGIIGRNWLDFVQPDVAARRQAYFDEVVRSGKPVEFEDERKGRSIRFYVTPAFDHENKVCRVAWVAIDLTDLRNAERALRISEVWYKTLVDNIPGAVIRVVTEGDATLDFMSDEIESITGYPPSHFWGRAGSAFMDLVYPEDRDHMIESVGAALDQGRTFDVEYRLRHRDGGTRYCRARGQGIRDKTGSLVCIDSILYDITEMHAEQEAARETEQRYRLLAENASDLIWQMDLEGRFTYVSPAVRQYGYEPEEWVGERLPRFLPPHEQAVYAARQAGDLAAPRPARYEVQMLAKDGSLVWMEVLVDFVFQDGRPVLFQGIARDITERRNAEEALRQSEERYKSIVENTHDLIVLNDSRGKSVYLSPACKEIVGYDPEELRGLTASVIHPDDRIAVLAATRRGFAGESGFDFEYRVIAKSGETKWVSHSWVPITRDNNVEMVVSVVRDITERRKSEEALREAHTDLEKAYKVQQEFLNNVTHEIRTPMTAVKGYVEMLIDGIAGDLNDEQAKLLRRVMASSDSLLELVTSLLEVARLRSGSIGLRPTACKPGEVAAKAAAAVAPQAAGKGLTVDVRVTETDRIGVYDEQKLTMILTNLLSNAVKFTGRGGVDVTVTPQPSGVEIIVVDSGMGIRGADLSTVFDEFRQLDYPSKYKPSGFGLGLAIVAAAVESIGATLVASSRRDVGTAFTLWVPRLEA